MEGWLTKICWVVLVCYGYSLVVMRGIHFKKVKSCVEIIEFVFVIVLNLEHDLLEKLP